MMLGTGGYDVVQEILAGQASDAKTSDLSRDLRAAAAKQVGQPKARGGGCFWLLVLLGLGLHYASDLPWRHYLQPDWWFAKMEEVLEGKGERERSAERQAQQRQLARDQAARAAANQAAAQARAQEQLLRQQADQALREVQALHTVPVEQPAPSAPPEVRDWFERSAKRLRMCLRSLRLAQETLELEVVLSASGDVLKLTAQSSPSVASSNLLCMRSMLRSGKPPLGHPGRWRVWVAPN